MAESLSDRLKSLGVKIGARDLPRPTDRPARKRGHPISEVAPGRSIETEFGDAYIVEQDFPAEYTHGTICFSDPFELNTLCQWGQSPDLAGRPLTDFLFLDTETSGLAGGSGTYAFMVGMGFWTASGFRVAQLFMEEPVKEAGLVAVLDEIVRPFQALVTFNGKSFDIPILNTRHIINQMDSPFPQMGHLDLLMLARRLWRNRLPSRALGSLEIDVLGVRRSGEDISGWEIPEMYNRYLATRDARPLAGIFYHNSMDILSLAALFCHTARLLTDPLGCEQPESLDVVAIARLYEELGNLDRAVELYEAGINLGLPDDFRKDTFMRYAGLYRKREEWSQAVGLWERAALYQLVEPCIELAKYYEHQARNPSEALRWTEQALRAVDFSRMGLWEKRSRQAELQHRANRLQRKLEGKASGPDVLE